MVDHQHACHRTPSQAVGDHAPGFFVGDARILANVDDGLSVSLFLFALPIYLLMVFSLFADRTGSSPRMRGAHDHAPLWDAAPGIIPGHAGNMRTEEFSKCDSKSAEDSISKPFHSSTISLHLLSFLFTSLVLFPSETVATEDTFRLLSIAYKLFQIVEPAITLA